MFCKRFIKTLYLYNTWLPDQTQEHLTIMENFYFITICVLFGTNASFFLTTSAIRIDLCYQCFTASLTIMSLCNWSVCPTCFYSKTSKRNRNNRYSRTFLIGGIKKSPQTAVFRSFFHELFFHCSLWGLFQREQIRTFLLWFLFIHPASREP